MTETHTHTPLPCPFCGFPLVGVSIPADPRFKRSVKCPSCHSHGGWGNDDAEAIDAWNTRADSHHRLVEALRYLLDEVGKSACAGDILDSAAAGKAFAIIAEMEGRRG